MQRNEVKAAPARKPLRDVSNGNQIHHNNDNGRGGKFSKSANLMQKKKAAAMSKESTASLRSELVRDHKEHEVTVQEEEKGGGGENECLDRLLLAHSHLSSVTKQADELVAQAFQLKAINKEGRQEIVSFTHALSDMLTSLKSWVPRLQKVISSSSVESESQLAHSLEDRTVSTLDEFENFEVESPEQTKMDSLISPSPLVSWPADRHIDRGRQLFLLTPLHVSKMTSSKCPRLSESAFEKIVSNPIVELQSFSTVSGDEHVDLPESVPAKPTQSKASAAEETEKTFDCGCVSSPMLSRRDQSILVMTPCLKMSPPKSCVLLEPVSESGGKHNRRTWKSTPFPVGVRLQTSESSDSESSEDLPFKYPELLGIQRATKSKMVNKEFEASPDWSFSPPKTCVLLEPQDEKSPDNVDRGQRLPLNPSVWNQRSNLTELKEHNGQDGCAEMKEARNQEPKVSILTVLESTPMWQEPESTIRKGKHPGENTLKKELWTKFEAASTRGLCLNVSAFHQTAQKKFLDKLDEVSCDG